MINRLMKNKLFIHSLFRSGSTYFFNKLRQNNEFMCFYEPLHQDLIKLKPDNIDTFWGFTHTSEITKKQNHPKLTSPHFKEYEDLFDNRTETLPYFQKPYSFDEYTEVSSIDFKSYIDSLIALGSQKDHIPILQFNRTTQRINWFQKTYKDALNVYLLRNPRDQFESYLGRSDEVFEVMNLLIVKSSNVFNMLKKKIELPFFQDTDFQEEYRFYREFNKTLSHETKYEIFFTIWVTSLEHAVKYSDEIIIMDKLQDNSKYREKIRMLFSKHFNYKINLDDFAIKHYDYYSLPFMICEKIENDVVSNINPNNKTLSLYKELDSMLQIHNTKPLVTVVTVVYNDAKGLESTIQNLILQTYSNIEYIIIDGASTDGTVDIIQQHNDQIDYWTSEPDNGIYEAMNKAIDIAKGEWVNFMNAGDTFVNENVVTDFIHQLDNQTEIYYGSRYINMSTKSYLEKTLPLEQFFYNMPFGHQSAFIKHNLVQKYKFDTSYKLSADYDFFLHCYKSNITFKDLGFPICNFTIGGLSYQQSFKSLLETLKALSDHTDSDTIKKSAFYKNTLKKLVINDLQLITQEEHEKVSKQKLLQYNKNNSNLNDIFEKMVSTSFLKNPIKKFKAYKEFIKTYNKLGQK